MKMLGTVYYEHVTLQRVQSQTYVHLYGNIFNTNIELKKEICLNKQE